MRNTKVCLAALALLVMYNGKAAFDSAQFNEGGKPLEISRITPDGKDVPAGRQLVFQFNQPVVPVGRMERDADEIPVDISPLLACEWRWLDTSALACQLGDSATMRPATRYRIVVSPGIETEDGRTLGEALTHEFITERPRVQSAWFNTWRGPGTPQINVAFNQLVTPASVERRLYLRRAGTTGQRLAVTAAPTSEEQSGPQRGWMLEPQTPLPLASGMELVVEPGLVSADGPERGREDRIVVSFDTFPEFRFLGARCTDNYRAGLHISPQNKELRRKCNPLSGIGLAFSAPVISDVIRDHMVFGPDLAGGREDYDPWENHYAYSSLGAPHQMGREYVVWLPENLRAAQTYSIQSGVELKDEFGRPLPEP
ncbi:MAG: large extracellular alpha-helical protein, partial [Gammaproteobacteria bacterium]